LPKKEEKLLKGKNVKYVTRETGNLLRDSVEPRSDVDSDDRPWNRVREAGSPRSRCDGGSTDGVERVASRSQTRSTRPTAGDTTSERQRLVRQEEAATRHNHSRRRYVKDVRPTNSLRRTVLNSTATHVNGSTSARSLDDSGRHSVQQRHTHGRQCVSSQVRQLRLTLSSTQDHVRALFRTHTRTHSPTTSLTTTGLLSFTRSAQLLELSSSYTVFRLHDNRLTVY